MREVKYTCDLCGRKNIKKYTICEAAPRKWITHYCEFCWFVLFNKREAIKEESLDTNTCISCGGKSGSIYNSPCGTCNGTGYMRVSEYEKDMKEIMEEVKKKIAENEIL